MDFDFEDFAGSTQESPYERWRDTTVAELHTLHPIAELSFQSFDLDDLNEITGLWPGAMEIDQPVVFGQDRVVAEVSVESHQSVHPADAATTVVVPKRKTVGRNGTVKCFLCRKGRKKCDPADEQHPEGPCIACRNKGEVIATNCRRTLPSDSGGTLPHRKSGKDSTVRKRPDTGVVATPDLHKKVAVLRATVSGLRKEVAALKAVGPAPIGPQIERESGNSIQRFNPHEPNVTCIRRVEEGGVLEPSDEGMQGFTVPESEMILLTLRTSGISVEDAVQITDFLEAHYLEAGVQITGLRSCLFTSREGREWPVVEWKEGQEVSVTGVFGVENQFLPCSYVLFLGKGVTRARFSSTWLKWDVVNIKDLYGLLQTVREVVGCSYWPPRERAKLTIEGNPEHCSKAVLRVWAQDRLSRFLETQDADSAFDEMISVLELVSSKEGNLYLFTKANGKTFTAEKVNEKGCALLLNLIYS